VRNAVFVQCGEGVEEAEQEGVDEFAGRLSEGRERRRCVSGIPGIGGMVSHSPFGSMG
jgi:hypothetical protein